MIARTITWRRVFIGARWAEIPVLHAHRGACGSQSCTSFTGARRVRLTKRAPAVTARGTARRHGLLDCGATRTRFASSAAAHAAHAGRGKELAAGVAAGAGRASPPRADPRGRGDARAPWR